MNTSKKRRRWPAISFAVLVVILAAAWSMSGKSSARQDAKPTDTSVASTDPTVEAETPRTRDATLDEVLELAKHALATMEETVEDYTARFTKQERITSGVLSEKTMMDIKVQTRLRNKTNDAPMRVYLAFLAPEATNGREVIWGKDLYDGKMAVHEVSLLLSWKTIWLNPTGMLAMAGQRYPISEIGVTGLVEKLIERGAKDLGNPDVTASFTRDYEYDGLICELIQVKRAKPSGGKDDFSLAEIIFDPDRMLILSYQSFGWADRDAPDAVVPLLESYQYSDLKTNVGLTDEDFDVTNENYSFP